MGGVKLALVYIYFLLVLLQFDDYRFDGHSFVNMKSCYCEWLFGAKGASKIIVPDKMPLLFPKYGIFVP